MGRQHRIVKKRARARPSRPGISRTSGYPCAFVFFRKFPGHPVRWEFEQDCVNAPYQESIFAVIDPHL
jgi:hypothetical protein